MIAVQLLNGGTPDHVGLIPAFLDPSDPRPAAAQFDERYAFGGGWSPMKGWTRRPDGTLKYPGDPPFKPLARMRLRNETITIHDCAWVCITQPDGSFEVSRMD